MLYMHIHKYMKGLPKEQYTFNFFPPKKYSNFIIYIYIDMYGGGVNGIPKSLTHKYVVSI